MVYSLTEIFRSIQGEGVHVGTTALFVRFAGCSMGCPWCDTDYRERERVELDELVKRIIRTTHDDRIPLIILTGGEPTEQDLVPLIATLMKRRESMMYPMIAVETNGNGDRRVLEAMGEAGVWITWSPKVPVDESDLEVMPEVNEIKLVLSAEVLANPEWVRKLEDYSGDCGVPIYAQPCSGELKTAISFVLERPIWKLSVQLHKLIDIA